MDYYEKKRRAVLVFEEILGRNIHNIDIESKEFIAITRKIKKTYGFDMKWCMKELEQLQKLAEQ